MRKWRRYVLILPVGTVVGFLVVGAFREREPEYGGKTLSDWVKAYGNLPGYSYSGPADKSPSWPIDEAIRQMGTNSLPYLVKWIRYEPTPLKARFYEMVNLNDPRDNRTAGAARAIACLWTDTNAAVRDAAIKAFR